LGGGSRWEVLGEPDVEKTWYEEGMADLPGDGQRHLARRIVAYCIDGTIASGLISLSFVALAIAAAISPDPNDMPPAAVLLSMGGLVVFSILGFGFFLLKDLGGGLVGKRLCGLVTVDVETGRPCSVGQSLLRNFLLILLQSLDLIVPLFRDNGRRIGDELARTIVIRKGS